MESGQGRLLNISFTKDLPEQGGNRRNVLLSLGEIEYMVLTCILLKKHWIVLVREYAGRPGRSRKYVGTESHSEGV